METKDSTTHPQPPTTPSSEPETLWPREIKDHKVNPVNDSIRILAYDRPGPGEVHHLYRVEYSNPKDVFGRTSWASYLNFQKGPIGEAGVNGVTHEALLAVIIDRMRSFQGGPFACRDNELALAHLETALLWLHKRTLDRMRRGVEGFNKA